MSLATLSLIATTPPSLPQETTRDKERTQRKLLSDGRVLLQMVMSRNRIELPLDAASWLGNLPPDWLNERKSIDYQWKQTKIAHLIPNSPLFSAFHMQQLYRYAAEGLLSNERALSVAVSVWLLFAREIRHEKFSASTNKCIGWIKLRLSSNQCLLYPFGVSIRVWKCWWQILFLDV